MDSLGTIESGTKSHLSVLALLAFKYLSGLVLGITLSLIGQEVMGYGNLSFLFVIVVVIAAFNKLAKPWGYVGVLIFDLVAILVATLLKMYIVIAPNL